MSERPTSTTLNDQIETALTALAAQRKIETGSETAWEADIPARKAAMDQLRHLAEAHPKIAPLVVDTLSAYVRDVSEYVLPTPRPEPDLALQQAKQAYRDLGMSAKQARRCRERDGSDEAAERHKYIEDIMDFYSCRADIMKAAQCLGWLPRKAGLDLQGHPIDLRGANLQRCSLALCDFTNANLEGACLAETNLFRTVLTNANLRGADLSGAYALRTTFWNADLDGATLDFEGYRTQFSEAQLANAASKPRWCNTSRFPPLFPPYSETKELGIRLRCHHFFVMPRDGAHRQRTN